MLRIVNGSLADADFATRYADSWFRLRARVFAGRLGWDVNVEQGREVDSFDDADSRYLLITERGAVVGGWRLRPTLRPYMLQQVFPQLLGGAPVPRDAATWEVSRFAIDLPQQEHSAAFGFNQAARALLSATARYALEHNIARYVMVASAGAERLYRNVGLRVQRFAPPQRIGRVLSVACAVDIDAHTCNVLLGPPLQAAA